MKPFVHRSVATVVLYFRLDLVSDLVKSNKITLSWFPCDCFESFLTDNFFSSEI